MQKRFFLFSLIPFFAIMASAAKADNLPDFTTLVKDAGPAVVNISTEKTVEQSGSPFAWNFPKGSPFDNFFKQFDIPGGNGQPLTRKEKSLGSGFIISQDGYIVTNNHVVENATSITVNLQGKNNKPISTTAEVVGTDAETDLALLKVKQDFDLPYLEFGDSDQIAVGEWVIAIGNPFGLDHSVTKGIISAKGRNIQAGPFDSFLQTDASINPGNSGGPLINMSGKVIGINTAIIASGQGIGFAIPSNMAKEVIGQLRTDKTVKRGWLGVQIQKVDESAAKALGLKEPIGALVGEVFPDGPAHKAGIKAGDVIIRIKGEDVADNSDLLHKVAALKPGTKVSVVVWRNGKERETSLTLGTRDLNRTVQAALPGNPAEGTLEAKLGINIRPLAKEEARALGDEGGNGLLVISVDADKPAAEAGLREGDILQTANLQELQSVSDLQKIIEQDAVKKGAVMFKVLRNGQSFFLAVPLDK